MTCTDSASAQTAPPTLNEFPHNRLVDRQTAGEDHILDVEDLPSHFHSTSFGEQDLVAALPDFERASSPWLADLLPGEISVYPRQFLDGLPLEQDASKSNSFSFSALLDGNPEDIEEFVRQSDLSLEEWLFQSPPQVLLPGPDSADAMANLSRGSELPAGSQEMLVLRFDKHTCGILSIKDGVHENPWRTLIWPLAKNTPALYHAIFSLAAFHSCKENPEMRVHGVEHMRQSITYMVQNIQNMRADAALATSLALAFADTWDQHTRTCIQHLRGARALVSQVLRAGMQNGLYGEDLERVRFLYNTWFYMDVIARLTSRDDCSDEDVESPAFHLLKGAVHEIDPLMGCAVTLFPLINKAARLIQRVRKSKTNSISLISQAIELKRVIEQWDPPGVFEPPEDPTSEVQHSIQIAHAYRWATLLYLHQAVPEMPSEPAPEIAKRVLILLATVPASSRTTIIQMFPLLAAGCEAVEEEDRNWVMGRWMVIQSRLMLGGIDRCLDVVREVWTRRDAYHAENQQRFLRTAGRSGSYAVTENSTIGLSHGGMGQPAASPSLGGTKRNSVATSLGNIEFEKTVRGRLHWVNVMEEWGWEGTPLSRAFDKKTRLTYTVFLG